MSFNPRASMNAALAWASGQQSVITPVYKTTAGEYPDPNFPFLLDIYKRDTDVYTAVNFISNRALGRGGHVECSPQAPNYMRSECEDFMEDYLRYIRWGDRRNERGWGPYSKIVAQELGYAGTSIAELLEPGKIDAMAAVQISSVWKFTRSMDGGLTGIYQYPQFNASPLDPDRFIVWRWNSVDRNPWGYGLAHSLAYPRIGPKGESIPPLILTWWGMQNDAAQRLRRYAVPHALFQAKGLSTDEAKPIADALKDPTAGGSYLTNAEIGVAMDAPTSRGNFQPEFDLIRNRIDIGLNALLSVMLASDKKFAYNSARVGQDTSDIIVWDLQQNMKTTTDNDFLAPVADQNGFDVNLLQPQWVYNIPDEPQEYNVADVINAFTQVIITKQDAVKILKELASWDIAPVLPTPTPMPGNLPMQTQPATPLVPQQPLVS